MSTYTFNIYHPQIPNLNRWAEHFQRFASLRHFGHQGTFAKNKIIRKSFLIDSDKLFYFFTFRIINYFTKWPIVFLDDFLIRNV